MELSLAMPPILAGLAAALWILAIGCILPDRRLKAIDTFDTQRLDKLRKGNAMLRWTEPLISGLLDTGLVTVSPQDAATIENASRWSVDSGRWKPHEFVAVKMIEGVLLGSALGFFSGIYHPLAPLVIIPVAALLFSVIVPRLALTSLQGERTVYLMRLKSRLPFALDLIALMMQASGTFQDALRTVVREEKSHPLGIEFASILRDIELGGTRADAFRAFLRRWEDPDLRELVTAILRGDELGTPISNIIVEMSEQFRLKRSQWIEKAAAQAQVKMVYPGFVVLFACLCLVMAPFAVRFSVAF